MNVKARHEHRRLQTPAHPCYCAIHRGGNSPKGYGHSIGFDGTVALWRHVAPGNVIETGPWFDDAGNLVDATVSKSPATNWGMRKPRRLRRSWAPRRHEEKLARQASRNPKFPSKAFLVAAAEWHMAGAEVTSEGPVYKARLG